MAATQPDQQNQQSAGLLLNLGSNNPFRNRAVSPGLRSPVSPFDDPPPRPLSRNPFLDPAITNRSSSLDIQSGSETMPFDRKPSLTAEDIFGSLTLEDTKPAPAVPPKPDAAKSPPPMMGRRGPPPPPGRENMPLPNRRDLPPNHRPTRSQEEALHARRMQANGGDNSRPLDPSRSPQRRPDRRPRRNSESSIMDADKSMTDEERKRRERERRHRHRENKDRKPVNRKLDIIDQLDATSIYGTGIFHHDGPFDALNPHRNRQGSRRAPMQAFPEGSLNNTIGGAGPLNARPDHATFLGQQDDEAFKEWSRGGKDKAGADYSATRKDEVPVFDPLSRGSVLHGDESLGLGTSTFLEGTPAARTAIQRREEEVMNEGLQRKKSLAHRIRNINRGQRDFQPSGRLTSPETVYGARRSPSESGPASAGLPSGNQERNPFFPDPEPGKRGDDGFAVRKTDSNGSKVSPTSPRGGPGLERRSTTDATGSDDFQPKASGILGRMKSLKGRRQRPAVPPGDAADGSPAPGTAV
ncbi:hypothetical protein VTK56DRAFT_2637 [Thermocarpiscus australiensis]